MRDSAVYTVVVIPPRACCGSVTNPFSNTPNYFIVQMTVEHENATTSDSNIAKYSAYGQNTALCTSFILIWFTGVFLMTQDTILMMRKIGIRKMVWRLSCYSKAEKERKVRKVQQNYIFYTGYPVCTSHHGAVLCT